MRTETLSFSLSNLLVDVIVFVSRLVIDNNFLSKYRFKLFLLVFTDFYKLLVNWCNFSAVSVKTHG